jgi:beta-lactam-binding protein with PASTA domain
VAGVLLFAAGAWAIFSASSRVTVPNVVGVSVGVARTRLAQADLETRVAERRFSARPQGEVLSQEPGQGTTLQRGDVVSLVASAGTEELLMPDVIGDGISFARGILEESGLVVVIEPVAFEAASDTVVSTTPAPGVTVRSGDVVRVQVASPGPGSATLQPYRMQGLSFTIDPAPVTAGNQDITLDVARRLRSLLEASGATVVVLRSGTETGTAESDRANRARVTNPTAAVGLSVATNGTAGRSVLLPPLSASSSAPSASLASAVTTELARSVPPTVDGSRTADPVLGSLLSPWVRVRLGTFEDSADASSFKDPRWADQVARALYKALGEVYGTKEEL